LGHRLQDPKHPETRKPLRYKPARERNERNSPLLDPKALRGWHEERKRKTPRAKETGNQKVNPSHKIESRTATCLQPTRQKIQRKR
jgi:hypothetical protein